MAPKQMTGTTLDPVVLAAVDALAAERKQSRCAVLRGLISRGLDLERAADLALVSDSVTFTSAGIVYRIEASYQ